VGLRAAHHFAAKREERNRTIAVQPTKSDEASPLVLAMLYLVLFSCLAVGFYAAVTTAVQVSANETHGRRAMLSAESGRSSCGYIMGNVDIPHSTPPRTRCGPSSATQVKQQLDGTATLAAATVAMARR